MGQRDSCHMELPLKQLTLTYNMCDVMWKLDITYLLRKEWRLQVSPQCVTALCSQSSLRKNLLVSKKKNMFWVPMTPLLLGIPFSLFSSYYRKLLSFQSSQPLYADSFLLFPKVRASGNRSHGENWHQTESLLNSWGVWGGVHVSVSQKHNGNRDWVTSLPPTVSWVGERELL